MKRFLVTLLATSLWLVSAEALAGLLPERTVLGAGDRVRILATHNLLARGDIYVGFMIGQGTPVIDRDGQGKASPSFADVSLDTPILAIEFTMPPGVPPGLYKFYEIVTVPGGDPMNVDDWVSGLSSADEVLLHVNLPQEISRDFNGDGFPDDDANHDGFHDDDVAHDGLGSAVDPSEAQAPGLPNGLSLSVEVVMLNSGADPDAKGKARFRVRDDGTIDFRVEIEDLDVGTYDLFLGGANKGQIQVQSRLSETQGEIEFRNPVQAGKLPLDFDPQGQSIEVRQGGTVFLQVDFPTSDGTTLPVAADASRVEVPFVRAGADPNAKGKARFRVRDDGRTDFRVEVENLAVGTYDLFVAATNRGQIQVQVRVNETVGEIEFKNPVEAGKLPLDFDPRGQSVEVRQGGTVFLTMVFP